MIKKEIIDKNGFFNLNIIKKQISIDLDDIDDDDLIYKNLDSAVDFLENKIHSDIYLKNNTLSLTNFSGDKLIIETTPLISVDEIKVNNIIFSGYTINDDSFIDFRIEFEDYLVDADIVVKFKTGYLNYDSIPASIEKCIRLLANDSYNLRGSDESYSEKSQMALLNNINPYIRKYY